MLSGRSVLPAAANISTPDQKNRCPFFLSQPDALFQGPMPGTRLRAFTKSRAVLQSPIESCLVPFAAQETMKPATFGLSFVTTPEP